MNKKYFATFHCLVLFSVIAFRPNAENLDPVSPLHVQDISKENRPAMVIVCSNSWIGIFVLCAVIYACAADYLDDQSFGMMNNPSWWKRSDSLEDSRLLNQDDESRMDRFRRGFNRYLSKHKGVVPYYLHRDGINYGGRPGGGSTRPWSSRNYGISRLRPSFGLMSIRTRSRPFGIKK